MTTAMLIEDLKRDEGLRLHAYPDPLSKAEPFTIGYGHTGRDVRPDTVWTQAQAEAALARDIVHVGVGLDQHLAWWRTLDDVRQDVLANMAFNMGVEGLLGFHNTLALVADRKFAGASLHMLESAWARQVGARAQRLAKQMATGQHQT